MASIGNALVGKILGHSAAEKAFRPWWDKMQDNMIYALITLSLIVLPTSIVTLTPLECSQCTNGLELVGICQENWNKTEYDNTTKVMGWNTKWAKNYCTYAAVHPFLLYYPHVLLIIALILMLIERLEYLFKSGVEAEAFYKFLITKNILGKEDQYLDAVSDVTEENNDIRALEMAEGIGKSCNSFASYVTRTVAELVIALTLFLYLIFIGFDAVNGDGHVFCPIKPFGFVCSGIPHFFYAVTLYMSLCLLVVYTICSVFSLLWLFLPQLGSLSSLMTNIEYEFEQLHDEHLDQEQEMRADLFGVYYRNKDLKLLLDLLALNSGVSPCLRVLCLLDRKMQKLAQAKNLRCLLIKNNENPDLMWATVTFDEPLAMTEIFSKVC